MEKNVSPDSLFMSHCAKFEVERPIPNLLVFEQQRGYLYQNGVEFRQKEIGAG